MNQTIIIKIPAKKKEQKMHDQFFRRQAGTPSTLLTNLSRNKSLKY